MSSRTKRGGRPAALSGRLAFEDSGGSRSKSVSHGPSWDTAGDDDAGAAEHFPQLDGPLPALGGIRELPGPTAALVDASLAPDPAERPALVGLMAGLEEMAGIPAAERRHG